MITAQVALRIASQNTGAAAMNYNLTPTNNS